MKHLKLWILLFYSIVYIETAISQTDSSKISLDLSVRYRFETWNGMNAKNYGDNSPTATGKLNDNILYQRIIVGLVYTPIKNLNIVTHLYDARAYGWSLRKSEYPDLFKIKEKGTQEPYYVMNPNEEYFEIYDAFIEYNKLFTNFSFKLGRQKIFYGDYHIFGPGEWGNTGRWTWDALKIAYKKDKNFIDIFAGGTKIHNPEKIAIPFTETEFWGGGIYGHYEWKKNFNLEPFYAIKKEGSADYIKNQNINRQWTGIRLFNNDFYHFIFDFTAVKEFGNENGKTIDAIGVFGKIGYQFNTIWAKPILSIRESYASGGKKADDKIKTFDPAFGAGDKFYGWMNITTWSNLDDREIVLELFPVKDLWIETKFNSFYIPEPTDMKLLNTMQLQTGKKHFGNELNIFIRWQAFKHWQFTGAFGYFWAGDLQQINNEPVKNASWFALQVLFAI